MGDNRAHRIEKTIPFSERMLDQACIATAIKKIPEVELFKQETKDLELDCGNKDCPKKFFSSLYRVLKVTNGNIAAVVVRQWSDRKFDVVNAVDSDKPFKKAERGAFVDGINRVNDSIIRFCGPID